MNIYQKAANHLKEMVYNNKPAINGSGDCMYRSPNGPCAIGFLISDEVYKETLEGETADDPIIVRSVAKSQGIPTYSIDPNKLLELQEVHDNWATFRRSEGEALKALAELGY